MGRAQGAPFRNARPPDKTLFYRPRGCQWSAMPTRGSPVGGMWPVRCQWAGFDPSDLIGRAAIIRQTTYPTRARVHTGECAMPLAPHGPERGVQIARGGGGGGQFSSVQFRTPTPATGGRGVKWFFGV